MGTVEVDWNNCNFVAVLREYVSRTTSKTSYVLYIPAVLGIVQVYEDKIAIADQSPEDDSSADSRNVVYINYTQDNGRYLLCS